jgi:2-amino-4-hydroxy-6-hydroxymethyldihydropteridine diphosphokinase
MLKSSWSDPLVRDVAYIALGSNLGDRHGYLSRARAALAALPDSRVIATSAIDATAPIGPVDQPEFLNQMVALETGLGPHDLLDRLLEIEAREGRARGVKWGPRTLDLDIVAFDRQTIHDATLVVPHPELPNRPFWHREMAELNDARSAR